MTITDQESDILIARVRETLDKRGCVCFPDLAINTDEGTVQILHVGSDCPARDYDNDVVLFFDTGSHLWCMHCGVAGTEHFGTITFHEGAARSIEFGCNRCGWTNRWRAHR